MVIFDLFHVDRLKSPESYVKCDFCSFNAAGTNASQDFWSEVESGGGSGDGSALAGVDGLIALAVGGGIWPGDVGRERDVSDLFDLGEEILGGGKANVAFAEFTARDDLGLKFIVVAEKETFADADLAAGTNEAFPFIGIGLELASEEDFDPSMEEVAAGGIARAEGLRAQAGTASVEAGGKYFCIVEDQEVGGVEEIGELAELAVLKVSADRGEVEEAGGGAVGEGFLRDEFLGEMVVEAGDLHGIRL